MTEDYCERDLVKQRLDITGQDDSFDDKLDAAIAEASAIVENEMVPVDGVPHPIPGIIQQACADIASAVFKQTLHPLMENPLYARGMDRLESYKNSKPGVDGIGFVVGKDES